VTTLGWRKAPGVKLDVPSHGSYGYALGCRCEPCRAYIRDYQRGYAHGIKRGRQRRPITHGTEWGYSRCRKRPEGACAECRTAATTARRVRRRAA
jgi:hypothetical protein